MATIKLFLGILCFAFIGGGGMLGGRVLSTAPQPVQTGAGKPVSQARRAQLVEIAGAEVGVREKTGNNDGPRVEEYLRRVGLKKGQPWCAAFVSWVYQKAGLPKPRTGWSPDMFPKYRLARSALPGNLLGIYFLEHHRIAHVGIIISRDGDWLNSVEGNTNLAGSREGQGVYFKKRHIKTIYRISDWITEGRNTK